MEINLSNEDKNEKRIKQIIRKKDREKRKLKTIIYVLTALVIVTGLYAYKSQESYMEAMENQYNQAFYELVGYVENVETKLSKAMIVTTPEYSTQTLNDIWREANLAQSAISQIPVSGDLLEQTNKYLNQVSDYSYTLSRACTNNETLTEEQVNNLKQMYTYSKTLKEELSNLSSDLQADTFSWNDILKKGNYNLENQTVKVGFMDNVNNNLQDYSGIIYDGAFSDHITQTVPQGLKDNEVTEEEAKQKIYTFIDEATVKEIKSNGLGNGTIEAYNFDILLSHEQLGDNYLNISITKKGGDILCMTYNRDYGVETISIEEAKQKGREYLNKIGYNNMIETYHMNENGSVIINYAYTENDIIMYTDLIKLKIALDNGEVVGMEANGYLYNHHDRSNKKSSLSINEAREKISPLVQIISERQCIIPTDWKTELLCYEFKGIVEDTTYLIYINAENGKEENIYILIDDENGMLTI
ncbi:MAG: germination protein YpeB [Clostridiales bacterium]|nr:germination protein YpeB [Clostridiales bacterium]